MDDKIQLIDLSNELLLHIDGEATKNHTIAWDMLRAVGDNLQELIKTLARYSLEDGDVTDLNNYTLDFTGFFDGSATPAFALKKIESPTLYNADNKIIRHLSADFSKVMYNVDRGNFQAIYDTYNTSEVANEVVSKVYNFTNAAGTTPVEIVRRNPHGETGWAKIYNIRKLSKDVYDQLIVKPKPTHIIEKIPDKTAVGRIIVKQDKRGKVSNKLTEIYTGNEAVLSLKIDYIATLDRRYDLKSPILFQFYQEGKGFIIENEQYDLFAAGSNMDEAKKNLHEQFDHTYQRLNQLSDDQLSDRLIAVKQQFNLIVKSVR